jgi:hypothetical protein
MDLLFNAIGAIDINGGGVDAPELVAAEVVEQQQVEEQEQEQALLLHLPRVSKSSPFLDGKLEEAHVYYDTVPAQIDWKERRKEHSSAG